MIRILALCLALGMVMESHASTANVQHAPQADPTPAASSNSPCLEGLPRFMCSYRLDHGRGRVREVPRSVVDDYINNEIFVFKNPLTAYIHMCCNKKKMYVSQNLPLRTRREIEEEAQGVLEVESAGQMLHIGEK